MRMTMALNWIPNVPFAGLWIALERGDFAAEGVEARFTPGGPNAPDSLVALAAGNAQLSIANWLPFLDAVARGNDFVIIGATYARSPGALCSMARRPVREPREPLDRGDRRGEPLSQTRGRAARREPRRDERGKLARVDLTRGVVPASGRGFLERRSTARHNGERSRARAVRGNEPRRLCGPETGNRPK
jgi:hypothetical protein